MCFNARYYNETFMDLPVVEPLVVRPDCFHAYHLYVVKINQKQLKTDREHIFTGLRNEGIGVNVHYIPVHLHPFYRDRFGYRGGECPVAEKAYEKLISLPLFHGMSNESVNRVLVAIKNVTDQYRRL